MIFLHTHLHRLKLDGLLSLFNLTMYVCNYVALLNVVTCDQRALYNVSLHFYIFIREFLYKINII